MARNFDDVFRAIHAALPTELADKLLEKAMYWAPEILWYNLSMFVNNNVAPSASDATAVKVYALLCDKTEEEIKADFLSKGYK